MSSWLSDLGRDARQAARQFGRRPAFTAAALLTLALGLGAPTAIFSIVQAVLLRPLPYADADRIVTFRIESQTPRGPVAFDALDVSTALEWSATSTALSGIALHNDRAMTLSTDSGPVRLSGVAATPNLFDVLATPPMAGAVFGADDRDVRQVVLSYRAWQQHFAASRSLVGTFITLDGIAHRVVGIMPAGFDFPAPETAFWVPVLLEAGGSRGMILPAIGRIRPGSSLAAVTAEGQQRIDQNAFSRVSSTLTARTLQDQMVGSVSRVLWVLMAAVSLVSVIATVNIALLLLTRGAGRAREFTIRAALGAGRSRLVRQVCVEGVVLAVLGGVGGLLFAIGAVEVLVRIAPPDVPRLHETSFDTRVLLFTTLMVITASLIFGALSAGRVAGARLIATRVSRRRLNVMAAAELALATVLLVGAGLLLRSFVGLVLIDHGFDSSDRTAMQVTLPAARYPTPEARMAFHDRLLAQLRQVDSVAAAGLVTSMPNRQPTGRYAYDPEGRAVSPDPFTMKLTEVRMATEGFFDAMGIPVLAGRVFEATDVEGAEPVIVIAEAQARVHFPDGNVVGRMLYSESGDRRVIGVVGDVRPATATTLQHDPSSYIPLRQELDVFSQFATMSILVRTRNGGDAASVVRNVVRTLDPAMPVFNVRTLDDEVAGLVAGPRFTATVLGLFAFVALVMATIGVYGVMSYTAGQRTREIGIRVALGATRRQVLILMLRDGVIVVGLGLVAGLVATMWGTQVLTGLLYEVTPADPVAILAVALLLSAAGVIAAYLPARRATRLSALAALRED
jgi:putative ABC transport system permease protein